MTAEPAPSETLTADVETAVKFLEWLRPGGAWLLAGIVPDGPLDGRTAETEQDVRAFVQRHDGRRNQYYTINPARGIMFSKAAKRDIARAEFLHAEVDPRDDETPEQAKARATESLRSVPQPSAVIDSGNGLQFLWRLSEPTEDLAAVEARNRGLAQVLDGDSASASIERVFRLPGTINLPNRSKRKRGRTRCASALLSLDDGRHSLDAFPVVEERRPAERRDRPTAKVIPFPPHLRERFLQSTGRGVSRDPEDILPPLDPAEIEAALAVIPSDYRQVWYRVGAALYSAFDGSEEGFAIFDGWSRTTTRDNYSEDSARTQWDNSAAFTDIGAGTIFHLADEEDPGWRQRKEETEAQEDQPTAEQPKGEQPKTPPPRSGLVVRALSTYVMEPVRWLWPNRFAIGKLSIIIGDPQEGKSQIAANIEARISRGNIWPNSEEAAPQGSIIVFAAEDGIADTIRPRFEAAGGDPSKVHIVEAVHVRDRGGRTRGFDLSSDLALLESEVRRIGDARVVRFDPMTAYMGAVGKIDSHNNTDVRAVLTQVSAFAERCNVAVIGVSHLAKNSTARAAVAAIGSIAFSAAARSVYVVVQDSENPGRRLFLRAKNNLAEAGGDGLAYRIKVKQLTPDIAAPVIEWDSERITITADEALAATKGGRGHSQARVMVWLRTALSRGPRPAKEMAREGEAACFTEKLLRSARERLGVFVAKAKGGEHAPWMWSLQEEQGEGTQTEMELEDGGI